MVYKLSEIEQAVRIAIDENASCDALLQEEDVETLSLNALIRAKAEEGARRVQQQCPLHYLEDGHDFGRSVYWEDGGCGYILLPEDFMRLISFKMSDWKRTLHEAIDAFHPLYARQSSACSGLRGNIYKPVCALVNRPEGKALEFYSCESYDAFVEEGIYCPYPKFDCFDGLDLSERCYESIIYETAALVLSAYGASAQSELLSNLSKTLLI